MGAIIYGYYRVEKGGKQENCRYTESKCQNDSEDGGKYECNNEVTRVAKKIGRKGEFKVASHSPDPKMIGFPKVGLTNRETQNGQESERRPAQYCGAFTILPDFWKYWALKLDVASRDTSWKLDFNAKGYLAQNLQPHGAAAVKRDSMGIDCTGTA